MKLPTPLEKLRQKMLGDIVTVFAWMSVVLLVLLAENAGHVKAVASMVGRPESLDPYIGRSFMADGVATTVSGLFGGSGTTTYAENIGVMAITRVYSTAAYIVAGLVAIALGLLPKFGALISAIPQLPFQDREDPQFV